LFDRKAIIDAYNNPQYAELHKGIKAVVFLGTPHRGADLASILDAVLTVSFSSRTFVTQLKPNSEAIKSINHNFIHRVSSLKLVSFFETDNTRVQWVDPRTSSLIAQWILGGTMVVPENSATLQYPGETRVGLNGNHLTIAKYKSRRDPNFTAVSTELHRLVSEIVSEPVTSLAQAKYDQRLQALIALDIRKFS